jgi:molybdopterin/thiamine biosynthesis adenylyltransferase
LHPREANAAFYAERTDRNIGWITPDEQALLRGKVVGVAGCGGMGGLLAQIFLRLGIGEIRIADCEVFDASNINRQFAAMRTTIGKPKAFETARLLRAISDDTTLVVYPQGITEDTAGHFLAGCDIVCDMIEFWAIGARILLHQVARQHRITLLNCDTVGHRTFLFRFTHDSAVVEDALGFTYSEAKALQERLQQGTACLEEKRRVMEAVLTAFVPDMPEYIGDGTQGTAAALTRRLFDEGKASIIATNPPMAAGFIANHALLALLEESPTRRTVVRVPAMPGYLAFDAALMQTWIVTQPWWTPPKQIDRGGDHV